MINTSKNKEPLWVEELRSKYLAGEGIIFILHANVLDLVPYEGRYVTLKEFLSEGLLNKTKNSVIYYDSSQGISFLAPEMKKAFFSSVNARNMILGEPTLGSDLPKYPGEVLPLLEKFLKVPGQNTGIVFGYSETIFQTAEINFLTQEERSNLVTLQRWASDPNLLDSNNLVILVTENLTDINLKISRNPHVSPIEIPMPDYDERLEFIKYDLEGKNLKLEMSVEQFAHLTAGLRKIQIEGLVRQAIKTDGLISFKLIKEKKKDIIENECFGLVELVEPKHNLDGVGGMGTTKNYLRKVLNNIREGNHKRVPMGIFFVGPMGTGKTYVAEAFAGESAMTCLKLKNFRDKWVGSTEANLEKILNVVKALGSTIIIVDEVDRALGGDNEGDSGTSSRVYAKIKAFMSDTSHRGKILWLIMSNRPDKLDIDLKRPGRFDSKIPFFYPQTQEESTEVIKALFKKNRINYEIADFSKIYASVQGYAGADLEAVVLLSDDFASEAGRKTVGEEDFLNAVLDFIPNRDSLMIEFMEYLAVFECSSRRMIPPRFQELTNEQINNRLRQLKEQLAL